jgi:hypothetical protein
VDRGGFVDKYIPFWCANLSLSLSCLSLLSFIFSVRFLINDRAYGSINDNISTFEIVGCKIDMMTMGTILNFVRENPSMRILSLKHLGIDDNNVRAIMDACTAHPSLQVLSLACNNITKTQPFNKLLSHNACRLTGLDLSHNQIGTEEGMKPLRDKLMEVRLELLGLLVLGAYFSPSLFFLTNICTFYSLSGHRTA